MALESGPACGQLRTTFPRVRTTVPQSEISRLEAILAAMPPVVAMQVRIVEASASRVVLAAPLAANVNDKGCAFGGSMGSLMTLAGWALAWINLAEAGHEPDLYIASSDVRFLSPVTDELRATAVFTDAMDWPVTLASLEGGAKPRIQVEASIASDHGDSAAAVMRARYVAVGKG